MNISIKSQPEFLSASRSSFARATSVPKVSPSRRRRSGSSSMTTGFASPMTILKQIFKRLIFFSYLNTHTDSENESEHRSNEHYLGLFFTAAWEVFITAMFSFIFTSLTAVHIYDFHIFTVTQTHTPKKNIKKKSNNTNNTTEKRKNKEKEVLVISLYKFLGFWGYLLRYDRLKLLSMRYFDSADSFCRRLIACTG